MKEEPQENWPHYLTVGNLRKAIEKLPDSTPVFYHRIEDTYFEHGGWATTEIESGEHNKAWDKGWIRAFSAFVSRVMGKGKKVVCITAHY